MVIQCPHHPNTSPTSPAMFSFEIEAKGFWAGRNLRDHFNWTVKSSFFLNREKLETQASMPCSKSHSGWQSQNSKPALTDLMKRSSLLCLQNKINIPPAQKPWSTFFQLKCRLLKPSLPDLFLSHIFSLAPDFSIFGITCLFSGSSLLPRLFPEMTEYLFLGLRDGHHHGHHLAHLGSRLPRDVPCLLLNFSDPATSALNCEILLPYCQ